MIILGVESSCDETSISVINVDKDNFNAVSILSCETFSQAEIHAEFGGVVPEVASRNHMLKINPIFKKAISKASISKDDIDLIAVTAYPGLVGALFVGVSFAKGLAYGLKKPLIPINHLSGHILSAELSYDILELPYIALVISGGHTHIYDVAYDLKGKIEFNLWGKTIDDAAGEAFDKVSKMLGGPYPGGPYIEDIAKTGDKNKIIFPISLKNTHDFSFSGIKTSVLNTINKKIYSSNDIAASFQATVSKTLVDKIKLACADLGRKRVVVAGGVACNSQIRDDFNLLSSSTDINVFFPDKYLCNDNAAMIAYAGYRLFDGDALSKYYNYNFDVSSTASEIDY